MSHPVYLNIISFLGIFGLCGIAWLFSEQRRVIPWRVIIWGIGLQLLLSFFVFQFPPTRKALEVFSGLLDGVFTAADNGARFVFGKNIVPIPGENTVVNLGYIFAFRALPTVIFFSGLMALLYNIGIIQIITNIFAKVFYWTMRLSGAEALSGAANIFVGIEAAIVVKPFLAKMTRSELCAILACCFGTAASSTLAIYVSFLRPVFPNILGHLVSASIIAIPACFVISKILVPETEIPLTLGGIPTEKSAKKTQKIQKVKKRLDSLEEAFNNNFDDDEKVEKQQSHQQLVNELPDKAEKIDQEESPKLETVGGEPIERVSPLDAAIIGALDGVKMAVAIAAVLILILGLVSLINQTFSGLANLKTSDVLLWQNIGKIFSIITLQNIEGVLFYPLTILTGVPFNESWTAAVIIGRRLLETAIPPYQALAEASKAGVISDRTVLIVSYALSGFAHLASVGIFVGGTISLIPSRRKDISELGWKALFAGTLATMMIACLAGVFDTGDPSILGEKTSTVNMTVSVPNPQTSLNPASKITSSKSENPNNIKPQTPSNTSPAPVNTDSNSANSSPNNQQEELNRQQLEQARLLITPTPVSQYNKAIAEAQKIKPDQPLYAQAQKDIERWSNVILDTAQGRAKKGNFEDAIAAAKLIPSANPTTYKAAQIAIKKWQQESTEFMANQKLLEKAIDSIQNRQASSYYQAIGVAKTIPLGKPKYAEAQKLINEWSQTILDIAKKRATQGNLNIAITTAKLVPENTSAYNEAQQAIINWQTQLQKSPMR